MILVKELGMSRTSMKKRGLATLKVIPPAVTLACTSLPAPIKWMTLTNDSLPEREKMQGVEEMKAGNEIKTIEREVTGKLKVVMTKIAERNGSEEMLAHGEDYEDEDWECPHCSFTNYSRTSYRMFCAQCHRPRNEIPLRSGYLLTGGSGSGKSVVLGQLIHWARTQGWLALVVPSGWRFANWSPMIVPSQHIPDMFEDPFESTDVLQSFVNGHSRALLESIPIREKVASERWNNAQNLAQLLDAALDDDRFEERSTALFDIIQELSTCVEAPCLVAVDEIETFFAPYIDHYYDSEQLVPEDLIGISRLRAGLYYPQADVENDPHQAPLLFKRGLALYATHSYGRPNTLGKNVSFRTIVPHMPHELRVLPFDDAEFQAACDFYRDDMVADKEALTYHNIRSLKLMTQRNPRKLYSRLLLL